MRNKRCNVKEKICKYLKTFEAVPQYLHISLTKLSHKKSIFGKIY